MARAVVEKCCNCGYDLSGVPLNEFRRTTCPECGHTQPSIPSGQHTPPSRRNHIIAATILASLLPVLFIYLGADTWGYTKLGVCFWGFILSPPVGGTVGFGYAVLITRALRRRDPYAPVARLGWPCFGMGLLAGFLAMIIAAVVLYNLPPGANGWNC